MSAKSRGTKLPSYDDSFQAHQPCYRTDQLNSVDLISPGYPAKPKSVTKQLHAEPCASVSILRFVAFFGDGGLGMHTRQYFITALTFAALSFVQVSAGARRRIWPLDIWAWRIGIWRRNTPPPGTYVTYITGFYEGKINADVTFGNVTVNAGAKLEFFQMALNGLYVPDRKVLGGQPGFSVTIPVGHVDLDASVTGPLGNTFSDETSGWGLGDITTRAQLGWQDGDFAHLAYAQVVATSGHYEVGFVPIIGLNRPGIDIGWSFHLDGEDHEAAVQWHHRHYLQFRK